MNTPVPIYEVEYQKGNVAMVESNLLLHDTLDMQMVEFWEERLTALDQAFVVAFRRTESKVLYSIFTDTKKKGSVFRGGTV